MNEHQIVEFSRLIEAYLTAHRERMPSPKQGDPHLWADRPIRDEYRAVLNFVLSLPGRQQRYATETVESLVDDLLTAALRDNSQLEEEVRHLVAVFSHDPVTRLYVPLDGVSSDAPNYDIGALRLINMNDAAFDRLVVAPFAEIMNHNPYYSEEEARALVEAHCRRLLSLRGRVCAEILTNLDIPKTFTFAEDSAVDALCDFLQFVASLFLAHDKKLKIGWATDARAVWRHAFAISDRPLNHSNDHNERVSAGHMLGLTADRIATITELGLNRIADTVGREPPTEYDELLRRAVRWFAKAEREDHLDDRKLSYITAVDLFFSEEGPGATGRICKGFAFALARTNDDVPAVARYMFRMFASRSVTSHAGELGVMEEDDLRSLRRHVQQFIIAMSVQAFEKKDEVKAWIVDREARMGDTQRQALRDATDWRMAQAEDYVNSIAAVLGHLLTSRLYDGRYVPKTLSLSRVLRDAARSGGRFIRELRPCLSDLDAAHELITERIREKVETQADALAYYDEVVNALGRVKWVYAAINA